jgi:hypothetical protein
VGDVIAPVLIGYFPKRVTPRPDWLETPSVREICSVSECIAAGPPDWIARWTHNALWVYDSVDRARDVIPPGAERGVFALYAYRLLPLLFRPGSQEPLPVPPLVIEPLPEDFVSLGWDVVSRSAGTTFECSPLSCNHMARECAVNEFCLVPALQGAIDVAVRFAAEPPEPGPYVVVEVLRERSA